MSEFDNLHLSPYYLNTRRLGAVTGNALPIAAQTSIAHNSGERAAAMRHASYLAETLLHSGQVTNLTKLASSENLEGQRVFGFLWGVFTFRGASQAIQRECEGKLYKNASFSGRMPIGEDEYVLSGELFNDHFYSTSSAGMLSGKRHMLIAGHFEFKQVPNVEVFPYIIGEVIKDLGTFRVSWSSSIRVHPSSIDAFNKMSAVRSLKKPDLRIVLEMPEESVKRAFAEIIGEPFIPKDWPGEKSDLVTSRLTINGRPTTAAFIFKGPSVSGTMHPSNMGKRGDQLIRAFDEAVDLIVVQHCNEIANNVVRMTEALSCDLRRPRRYCIIDGADTARILKAYDKL